MDTTYEIIDDSTLKVTTPQPPKEELVDLTSIAYEKDALIQGLADLDLYYAAEQARLNARITEIDTLLSQGTQLRAATAKASV